MGSVKTNDIDTWRKKRLYSDEQLALAKTVLEEVRAGRKLDRSLRDHPGPGGGLLAKHILIAEYHALVESGEWQEDEELLKRIRMKPVRTLSGVTTVTVLTKAYPARGAASSVQPKITCPRVTWPMSRERRGLFKTNLTPSTRCIRASLSMKPWVTPPTRSNCSSSAVRGVLTAAITRSGSSSAASTP
jgi:elongator complex protein 3